MQPQSPWECSEFNTFYFYKILTKFSVYGLLSLSSKYNCYFFFQWEIYCTSMQFFNWFIVTNFDISRVTLWVQIYSFQFISSRYRTVNFPEGETVAGPGIVDGRDRKAVKDNLFWPSLCTDVERGRHGSVLWECTAPQDHQRGNVLWGGTSWKNDSLDLG